MTAAIVCEVRANSGLKQQFAVEAKDTEQTLMHSLAFSLTPTHSSNSCDGGNSDANLLELSVKEKKSSKQVCSLHVSAKELISQPSGSLARTLNWSNNQYLAFKVEGVFDQSWGGVA